VSKFLVVSHKHELLPFANRLRSEGHDVRTIVWKQRYEKAWEGRLKVEPRPKQIDFEDRVLMTNVPALQSAPVEGAWFNIDGPPCESDLRFGVWWTGSEFAAPHLLIVDRGAWPGGLGPSLDAAMTLIRLQDVPVQVAESLPQVGEVLAESSFRGLVQVDYSLEEGKLTPTNISAGWSMLHTHLFVANLNFGAVLDGDTPALPWRYQIALVLSVPPWPNLQGGRSAEAPVEGLNQKQLGQLWWHDVRLDPEQKQLLVGSLDGLLGVPLGAANSLTLAQGRCIGLAQALQVPEKRFRYDAGSRVPQALALLEDRLGVEIG
jgi:hypothetical protein